MITNRLKLLGRGKRLRQLRVAAVCAVAAGVLANCGGGSMFGAGSSSSGGSSLGSRFSQLFGSSSQPIEEKSTPAQVAQDAQLTCPPVSIRAGASTLPVGLPGKPAAGNDLRYQMTITRTARDCNLTGNQITARVGIEGRIIVGPAGAPPTVDIPLRVAIVQEGIQDKVIFTKAYRTSLSMADNADSAVYNFVAEDVIYPVPQGGAGDSYVFYIGFDPNGLKPEPAPRRAKRPAKPQG